jgi:NADPH:quinone reductase-like Zn-dependent oxidoreductase
VNNPASSEALNRLAQLVDAGRLRMLKLTRMPLEEASKALERYHSGHVHGRTVLVVSE